MVVVVAVGVGGAAVDGTVVACTYGGALAATAGDERSISGSSLTRVAATNGASPTSFTVIVSKGLLWYYVCNELATMWIESN